MQIFQFVRTWFLLHSRDVVKVNNEDFCRINVTEFNECISLGCVAIFSIRYYYQVFFFSCPGRFVVFPLQGSIAE